MKLVCSKCGLLLPAEHFFRNVHKHTHGGREHECKDCQRSRRWEAKASNLQFAYGAPAAFRDWLRRPHPGVTCDA